MKVFQNGPDELHEIANLANARLQKHENLPKHPGK